ncbi:MAG: glutathione peroxidase [Pseudomonadota bacterium]
MTWEVPYDCLASLGLDAVSVFADRALDDPLLYTSDHLRTSCLIYEVDRQRYQAWADVSATDKPLGLTQPACSAGSLADPILMETAMPLRRTILRTALGFAGAAMLARMPAPARAGEMTAHDFAFAGIDGGVVRLLDYAGSPVLVVNTASRCGFTYQYDALQALYDRYRDQGLVVLGVPSDDFGGQELATEAEVKHFCEVNFAIDFPMTGITPVRGKGAHPFYAWAQRALGKAKAPRWNFHKYLVGPDGRLVAAFGTSIEPSAPAIATAVEALLPADS